MAEQQPSHPETGIAADQTITRIEKHALEQLTELVAYRDEAETSIDRTHKSRRASTDRQLEESLSELQARYERDRKVALSEYDATREDTTKHYDKEEKKAAREYEGQSFRVGEQADHDEAATKKLWKDARWTAETVYEAKEKQPSARCKKTTKALHGRLTGLQGMHSRAGELLRMYRQGGVAKRILAQHADGPATAALPEGSPAAVLEGISNDASSVLRTIQKAWFARWWIGIRPLGIILFIAAVAAALNGWMTEWKFDRLFMEFGIGAGVVSLLVLIGVYMLGRKQVTPHFEKLTLLTAKGSRAHDAAVEEAQALCEREEAALKKQRDDEILEAKLTFEPRLRKIAQVRKELLAELETKYTQLQKSLIERRAAASQEIEDRHAARMSGLESNFEREQAQLRASHTSTRSSLDETYAQEWNELESRWTSGMASLHNTVKSVRDDVATVSRPWTDSWWTSFKPPREFARAIRYGEFTVNLQALPGGIPRDPRLLNAGPFEITMPAVLDFPTRTSLLLETGDDAREEAADALRNVMMRLLTTLPAGQVRFTIIDPVGLGQNFAGFMHLADYEEAFVADRIWTETRHIEQRLTDLTEHMEDVIQKYLRNDFETITQYNLHAGEIAEPFRFLVIANFPVNFSDTAARRLVSIVDSGPRCGVYTLMTMDTRQAMPQGFQPQDLRKGGVVLVRDKGRWVNTDEVLKQWPLALDPAPAADFITETLKVVGEAAKDSTRVEVPFEHVTPPPDEYWTSDSSREIVVPLGRAGATKLQHLELGRGITQHALIAGRTGSGKSTLLHVLVTNLALRYHPDQLEFYLVDFKKGVEFKTYATHSLPHARAVAIESDREFGLSVLERLDGELRRRGEIFRNLGVQDVAAFRKTDSNERMPRTLLVIDEFQELFVEDDKLSQDASLLLDRLVRQGRAFGIHVLLGSQTLGGAYSLARSTIGQMAVRIALQCNEADAMLIMGDDNTAARLLSRPGEALYNDQSGLLEGNHPFQIVWLPDHVREHHMREIESLTAEHNYQPPEPQIVFEGNVPADARRNTLLANAIEAAPASVTHPAPSMWLGDAIAIKEPTAAIFRAQTGTNLLMLGQQDEAALAMQAIGLVSLAAQSPVESSIFYVLDGQAADSPFAGTFENIIRAMPYDIRLITWHDVPAAMGEMDDMLRERGARNRADQPPVFLFIYGLQRFRMLRLEEDFGFTSAMSSNGESEEPAVRPPDKIFGDLLRDGPPLNMHTIAWCDTVNNLNRNIDRKTLREFDMRLLFQMSSTDSSNLIDTPAASLLGQKRALFHSEDHGILEKFRPYALPDAAWIESVGKRLRKGQLTS